MDFEKIKEQFNNCSHTAELFRAFLVEQIEKVLELNQLTLGVPVESRVKTLSSVINKDKRKPQNFNSLLELDDFIGLRLIFLFKRDLASVLKCLSKDFVILKYEDKSEGLEEDKFGYQSYHYVVKLPDEWLKVPTLAEFKNFKAEIQVRTLSQHIWAATSHKLQYKKEHNVPLPLRRAINRVSALLEVVDLEFERVLLEREGYVEKINELTEINGNAELNVDLLKLIAEQELPPENKETEDEDFDDLLSELLRNNITTINDLLVPLRQGLPHALEDSKLTAKQCLRAYENNASFDDDDDKEVPRWRKGIYYSHVGLIRISMVHAVKNYKRLEDEDEYL